MSTTNPAPYYIIINDSLLDMDRNVFNGFSAVHLKYYILHSYFDY